MTMSKAYPREPIMLEIKSINNPDLIFGAAFHYPVPKQLLSPQFPKMLDFALLFEKHT
jgi:hypothetical protein